MPRKTLALIGFGVFVAYEAYTHAVNFAESVAYELATGGWASRERQGQFQK